MMIFQQPFLTETVRANKALQIFEYITNWFILRNVRFLSYSTKMIAALKEEWNKSGKKDYKLYVPFHTFHRSVVNRYIFMSFCLGSQMHF